MMQVGFGLSAAESGFLIRDRLRRCHDEGGDGADPAPLRLPRTLIWNGVLSSLLYATCAAFRASWPHEAIFAVLVVCGFSMSLQFTAYNTLAYDDVPSDRMASANSFYTTLQQLMLSVGICAGALALTRRARSRAARIPSAISRRLPGRHRDLAPRRPRLPRLSPRRGRGDERPTSRDRKHEINAAT